jgi:chloramphenicol 3-O-phosphotransferase
MRPHRPHDPTGAAVFVGALLGFAVGAVVGISGHGMSSPVVAPLVGAICGVVITGLPFLLTGVRHRREEVERREARHQEFRLAAHDGWIEGIDLSDARRGR